MAKKKNVPIEFDDFRRVREQDMYFVDKSMMIADFIEYADKVALVTRPRRFGKTLNMTMLRDFLDITEDSRDIFKGLAIMDTEYAAEINSRPVIYITFENCNAQTPEELAVMLCDALLAEYSKYYKIARELPEQSGIFGRYEKLYHKIYDGTATLTELSMSVSLLEEIVYEIYGKYVVLLWDAYDTPVLSSYEYKYYDKITSFILNLYGSALKGQKSLGGALLTGEQRVAKGDIYISGFNNAIVYTMLDRHYASYFGFTEQETKDILEYYDLSLNDDVKRMYDGYQIGGYDIYNPGSILNYCRSREIRPYWVNTSNNRVIRESLNGANQAFRRELDTLVEYGEIEVAVKLETSYEELPRNSTRWGLLINAGYLTVKERMGYNLCIVRFANREAKEEFQRNMQNMRISFEE